MAFCLRERRRPLRLDDIHHGFRLRQVEAAIQEGPLREFTAVRGDGPLFQNERERLAERLHRAVDLDLHDILARVGMRRSHVDGEPFVHLPIPFHDTAEIHAVRLRFMKTLDLLRMKYAVCDIRRLHAGNADDADPALARAGRDRRDGGLFVHRLVLLRNRYATMPSG